MENIFCNKINPSSISYFCFILSLPIILLNISYAQNTAWEKVNYVGDKSINTIMCDNNYGIYVGTNNGLLYSSDTGSTWGEITGHALGNLVTIKDVDETGKIIMSSDSGYYASFDKGKNWYRFSQGYSQMVWTNGGTIFSPYGGMKFISNDTGKTWTMGNIFVEGLNQLKRFNNKIYICSGRYNYCHLCTPDAYRSGGIQECVDMTGNQWKYTQSENSIYLNFGITPQGEVYKYVERYLNTGVYFKNYRITEFSKFDQIAFIGNCTFMRIDSIIYWGINDGGVWSMLMDGLSVSGVTQIISNTKGVLFAITSDGIYRNTGFLSYATSVEKRMPLYPKNLTLRQNFPNPFNPSTQIEYEISMKGFTTLKVFNTLGQEIANLISKELDIGKYSETWDAIAIPSGIYFCILQSSNRTEAIKMILQK